jgi:hypothetical protein
MKSAMLQTRKITADLRATPNASRLGKSHLAQDSHAIATAPRFRQAEALEFTLRTRPAVARWSPLATLALSGGVSLLLWGALGLAFFGLHQR